jgi:hypothetical protein
MPSLHYISLIALGLLFAAQFRFRHYLHTYGKRAYQVALLFVLIAILYDLRSNFITIITGDIGIRYYGPPYTPISSFLFSAWSRILAPYVLSGLISLAALWAMTRVERYRDRFEAGEPYLIAIALLFLRQPFWLIYALLALVSYLTYSAIVTKLHGAEQRISFYYYWLPLAIIVLASTPLLKKVAFTLLLAFPNLR